MKYTFIALFLSLLVSSLSANLLYIDMISQINENDSIKDQKLSIIMKELHDMRDKVE
jgi:hypothetical protein